MTRTRTDKQGAPTLVAHGPRLGTAALVAAAIERSAIKRVELHDPLKSLHDVIDQNWGVDQKPELLPAPKEATPSVITITPWAPQPGTREIWQYYRVDSRGRFLPRVLYTPSGAFYLRNGEPYPWTTTRPTLWMPYVME